MADFDKEKLLGLNTTTYEFDFFSGSQIGVYFGDILVDDIASIQYSVSQSKRPIYGYASQYFHTIADGQVLVEGSIIMPFKEAGYLPVALANYSRRMKIEIPIQSDADGQHLVNRENIERVLDNGKIPGNKYEFYKNLEAMDDQTFENIAETFEDRLWKSKTEGENRDTPNLTHSDIDGENWKEAVYTHRRPDQYPAFDIWILYGDIHTKAANHTIKKLLQCSIVGEAQTISVGGEPILEQYSFIARNRV